MLRIIRQLKPGSRYFQTLKTAAVFLPQSSYSPTPYSYKSRHFSTVDTSVMDLSSVVGLLESIAPTSAAEDWDNVGLLVQPSTVQHVRHVFLTNDLTEEVLEEALKCRAKVDVIVSYHPPIFKPLKRLTQRSAKERIVLKSIESGIAIYSPHTAHDALWGGVNDWILGAFDDGVIRPLSISQSLGKEPYELIMSSLPDKSEANRVGKSIMTSGGVSSADITVSPSESLTGLSSYSLKCPVTESLVQSLIPMLMKDWPSYKFSMSPSPKVPAVGPGRLLTFATPCSLETLVTQIKAHLSLGSIRLARPSSWEEGKEVASLAVCVGSGASLLRGVRADVYLTGEMSHHEVLDATSKGIAVILCEHSNTERGFLHVFKKLIEDRLPSSTNLQITISTLDKDPLVIV